MLRDVAERDLATTLLGTEMSAPVLLAPIGVQTIVHPEGELATARAAAATGTPMVVSTAAAHTLEAIAAEGGSGPRWYQLYWPTTTRSPPASSPGRRPPVTTHWSSPSTRSSPAGSRATSSRPGFPSWRGSAIANFLQDPVFRAQLDSSPEEDLGAATGHYLGIYVNPSLSWEDIGRLREWTSLPIVVKGVLHPDDALRARERGIDGVIVSNHGGRQVDGAIASIDALPAVVEAAAGELVVLLDSGIRSGSDVIKALALGAEAVLLGRPYLWGLALEGEKGVETVLRMLFAELDLTLALCGYTTPAQLEPGALVRRPP